MSVAQSKTWNEPGATWESTRDLRRQEYADQQARKRACERAQESAERRRRLAFVAQEEKARLDAAEEWRQMREYNDNVSREDQDVSEPAPIISRDVEKAARMMMESLGAYAPKTPMEKAQIAIVNLQNAVKSSPLSARYNG